MLLYCQTFCYFNVKVANVPLSNYAFLLNICVIVKSIIVVFINEYSVRYWVRDFGLYIFTKLLIEYKMSPRVFKHS